MIGPATHPASVTIDGTEPQPSGPMPIVDSRPRLRGHIHFWTFFGTVAGAAALIGLAASTVSTEAAVAVSIYGLSILGLFGVSALYHRRLWSPRGYQWMKRADHSMIFLFIAGSYTPFALLAIPRSTGNLVLAVVWGGAIVGIMLRTAWPNAPRWVGVPIYIALGWVGIFVFPGLAAHAGIAPVVLLAFGGLLYTIGAVFYAIKWPNHWPHTFGYHEFFHVCTVLAATAHYVAIWLVMYS